MAKPQLHASKLDRAYHVLRSSDVTPFQRYLDPNIGPVLIGFSPEGVPMTMTETDDGLGLSVSYVFTAEALASPDQCALFAHACTAETLITRFRHKDKMLLCVAHYVGGVNADDLTVWVDTFAYEVFVPEILDRKNKPALLEDAAPASS